MPAEVTFLHGNHRPRCIASVDKRFTYHTLQLMCRGAVELFYDQRRHELQGRWVWPCQPGPWIRFHESPRGRAWDHRYIAFTGPRVAHWEAQGLWLSAPEAVEASQVRTFARRFDRLIELSQQPGRWPQLRAVNLLERLLLDLAERRDTHQPEQPDWLTAVLGRLADLHAEEPDYGELAEMHGMSLTTLRRQFRHATGTSLHQHRLACRIAAARQQLGDTDRPIKQIAEQLGYRDVFYFSRQFRQYAGVSPAAYRRSRQT